MRTSLLVLIAVLGLAGMSTAQSTPPFAPADIGVGLYKDVDPPVIFARDKTQWSQRGDLTHDTFGFWMRSPVPPIVNRYGTPVYMYKYRLSQNGGAPKAFGPYGFSSTGWGVSSLGSDVGAYKLEILVVDRDTMAETLVTTREFSIVAAGAEPGVTPTNDVAGTWDVYVGGLLGTPDENTTHYHAIMTINRNGPSYSGTLRFDDIAITEALASVTYNAGQLTFTRLPLLGRKVDQYYTAAISDNKLTGTCTDKTYNQKWWGSSKGH